MALSPLMAEVRANISDFQEKMAVVRRDLNETAKSTDSSGTKMKAASGVAMAALGGIAIASFYVGKAAIESADSFELAHARLQQAVKNSGRQFELFAPQVAATDATMRAFGYTDSQTEAALANLTTATRSPTEALKLLSLSSNVAAGRGIDLASAANIVTKAYQGNSGALRRLGIDLPVVSGNALAQVKAEDALQKAHQKVLDVLTKYPNALDAASKGHSAYEAAVQREDAAQEHLKGTQQASGLILDALTQRYRGQAAAAADTFAGKQRALTADLNHLEVNIGESLVPILDDVAKVILPVAQGFAAMPKGIQLAAVAGVFLAGTLRAVLPLMTGLRGLLATSGTASVAGAGEEAAAGLGATGLAGAITGPLGLAVVGLATVGLPLLIGAFHHTQEQIVSVTGAIGLQGKALKDYENQAVAAKLATEPWTSSLGDLGLNVDIVSRALAGNARAQAYVRQQIDNVSTAYNHQMTTAQGANGVLTTSYKTAQSLAQFMGATAQQTDAANLAAQNYARSLSGLNSAGQSTLGTFSRLEGSISVVTSNGNQFAHGTRHAIGGQPPAGGWSLVGEAGPELVRLPGGSRVTPAAQTAAAGGGGGVGTLEATIYIGSQKVETQVVQVLQRRKNRNGGTGVL